jgi:PilZ domain
MLGSKPSGPRWSRKIRHFLGKARYLASEAQSPGEDQARARGFWQAQPGQVVEISEHGMAVRLDAKADVELVGASVEIVIGFPGNHSVFTKGIVRRIGDSRRVLDIQFTELPAETVNAIRDYLARRGERPSAQFRISG